MISQRQRRFSTAIAIAAVGTLLLAGCNRGGNDTTAEHGNVYVTAPGGIWAYFPAGERIGIIEVPEQVANFTWGDEDGRTLYITAVTSVYRLRMKVAGIRHP
jgi:sugar lactone lactonase YvrE